MGSNFLDGCVAKRKHFYLRYACINNDFKEYWKEYFCSLVNYFKFNCLTVTIDGSKHTNY